MNEVANNNITLFSSDSDVRHAIDRVLRGGVFSLATGAFAE